ncbi:DUF302 domain-containing protein [Paenibacillus sp. FJAT-26967]|uniref:DUF302 domain-containing protein n=1 Tax=Paenibacillus sp. FJAT-26967 TaxID=1729690 RepID=UPI000838FEFA|nr:DUF302 domain-containing protein [Paenibacillus sp. FJAT-26967]
MFHYTVDTTKNLEQTIADLQENLKEEKFGVLWQLDMKDKLNEKGVDFDQPYHILEVCNPVEAKRVLSQNSLVGYFLPCKIAVYEEEGTTRIGMPRPTALIGLIENEEMLGVAKDIENRLIAVIDKTR